MGKGSQPMRRRRGTPVAAAAALTLAALGVAAMGIAMAQQESPPEVAALPPADDDSEADRQDSTTKADAWRVYGVEPLDRAEPISISIPAIGVDARIMELGLRDDRTVEVPPHAPRPESQAGWYRHSPTPGELGPSVIIGHVDSRAHGPAVFFEQAALTEGDIIEVDRVDGTTAVFEVDHTVQYGKKGFPTDQVYGNLDHAGLRLITCGGDFNHDTLAFEDNVVTYASLVSSRSE